METPTGRQGFVPANYVKLCDTLYEEVATPSAPRMTVPGVGGGGGGISTKGSMRGSMKSASIASAKPAAAPKAPGVRSSQTAGGIGAGKLLGM